MPPLPRAALIAQFDEFIRRDPARRGLIGSEPEFGPLCPGHLASAAAHLAEHGQHVAIVTGFYIPKGDPPAAETDGPLGTTLLAAALQAAGMHVDLITDEPCGHALQVATTSAGRIFNPSVNSSVNSDGLEIRPTDLPTVHAIARGDVSSFAHDYFNGSGSDLTHLISIERVGPSHTIESLSHQPRATTTPLEHFTTLVPLEHRDHCHNMRGEIIDPHTAELHLLFEESPPSRKRERRSLPEFKTIGIGDGGNEIGMGAVPWEDLERRLSGEQSGRVPCRIATNWNIVAGVSNWGAYALAAATLLLRGQQHLLAPFDAAQQLHVLEELITHGPAVDGVTRRREPTVDGLPFLTYIQPWEGMRRLLGLE